jgi:hypothetical protein
MKSAVRAVGALLPPLARRTTPVSHRTAQRIRGHVPPALAAPDLLPAPARWPLSPLPRAGAPAAAPAAPLPAAVRRAASASRGLPVYARGVSGRSSVRTTVRGVSGDADAFAAQLAAALGGAAVRVRGPASAAARAAGVAQGAPVNVEVDGHRVKEIKNWLLGLGM